MRRRRGYANFDAVNPQVVAAQNAQNNPFDQFPFAGAAAAMFPEGLAQAQNMMPLY